VDFGYIRFRKEVIYMKLIKELLEYIEVIYRSYRLRDEDIKAMSKKGYYMFDAGKGRFVKEPPFLKAS
jgi:hypothetical protein